MPKATWNGDTLAEAAPDEVARVREPVALEGLHGRGDKLVAEAMGPEFGPDPHRAVTRRRAAADQQFGKAGVVLPAGVAELVERRFGIPGLDAARGQLARKLEPRMLTAGEQGQRTLRGRGLGPGAACPLPPPAAAGG